jgi:ABC-2 type transport system permease protein
MPALIALIRKDLLLYFSNRRALVMTLGAPVAIAAFFGYLFDAGARGPARIPVALIMQDTGDTARKLVAALGNEPMLDLQETDEAQGLDRVRRGKVRAAIVFPPGFSADATRALAGSGTRPEIILHYDPSQAMALAVIRGALAQRIMQTMGAEAAATIARTPGIPAGDGSANRFALPFETSVHAVTATERRYNSYAHSFAGMGVQFVLFMGIEFGVGVLLARRLGLWKRLRAAPVSRALLLGSRIASGALTAAILLAAIFAAAMIFFGVRIDGSVPGFIAVALAFSVLTSTFGLLIAALGKTPEATRGLAIFATLIMVMLGGAWVPTFAFPEWLQTLSLAIPTRWAIDGLDAMSWRGLDLRAATAPVAAMLAFSALFAGIAIARFDWEE